MILYFAGPELGASLFPSPLPPPTDLVTEGKAAPEEAAESEGVVPAEEGMEEVLADLLELVSPIPERGSPSPLGAAGLAHVSA